MEAHNGLSARLVNRSKFDGVWESSLTDSASKGLPDIELVSGDSRLNTIREIKENTDKPLIVDWDTGGQTDHFPYWVKRLEEAGVDAIIIEDKAFPKRNSLLKDAKHILEDVDKFSDKIIAGKKVAKDMLIFARLESLIAKHSMYEALLRAEAFVNAGADGIMIHSKSDVGEKEVMEFAARFREKWDLPLIAVPTTYKLPEKHPFNIVIYANHLLRASLKAMQEFLDTQDEDKISSVKEIFDLVGTGKERYGGGSSNIKA